VSPAGTLACYSDRRGIFPVSVKDAQSGDGKAQRGWVADGPDIALITR
jgi:hypothetical protein